MVRNPFKAASRLYKKCKFVYSFAQDHLGSDDYSEKVKGGEFKFTEYALRLKHAKRLWKTISRTNPLIWMCLLEAMWLCCFIAYWLSESLLEELVNYGGFTICILLFATFLFAGISMAHYAIQHLKGLRKRHRKYMRTAVLGKIAKDVTQQEIVRFCEDTFSDEKWHSRERPTLLFKSMETFIEEQDRDEKSEELLFPCFEDMKAAFEEQILLPSMQIHSRCRNIIVTPKFGKLSSKLEMLQSLVDDLSLVPLRCWINLLLILLFAKPLLKTIGRRISRILLERITNVMPNLGFYVAWMLALALILVWLDSTLILHGLSILQGISGNDEKDDIPRKAATVIQRNFRGLTARRQVAGAKTGSKRTQAEEAKPRLHSTESFLTDEPAFGESGVTHRKPACTQ